MQNLWEKSKCLISVQPPDSPSTHFRWQFFPQITCIFLIYCAICPKYLVWMTLCQVSNTSKNHYPQFQFSKWGYTYHMGTSLQTERGINFNHQVIWQISGNSLFTVPTPCTKISCSLRLYIVHRAQLQLHGETQVPTSPRYCKNKIKRSWNTSKILKTEVCQGSTALHRSFPTLGHCWVQLYLDFASRHKADLLWLYC